MNKEEAEEIIIDQCIDGDGFLVNLRSHRVFQEDKYSELVVALETYRNAIASEALMSRMVAGCLHGLVDTLVDMAKIFPRNDVEQRLIEKAVNECLDLVEDIFTPEQYRADYN